MASSSNSLPNDSAATEEDKYLYASYADVSKYVSVKLSGKENYLPWKEQMLHLMKIHDMCGLVDASFNAPKASVALMKQYNNLLKGWIFGSVSQNVLYMIVSLSTAKDVWNKLKSFDDPTMSSQQDSGQRKLEAKQETNGKGILIETETVTKDKDAEEGEPITSTKELIREEMITQNKDLREATITGDWGKAKTILENQSRRLIKEAINKDGNTVVHLAVGLNTHKDFVKSLFEFIEDKRVFEKQNVHGSTVLHIAAIVGNENAAKLLVEQHKKLLTIVDNKGEEPLFKAYSSMQFNTFIYLLKAANDNSDSKTKQVISHKSPNHMINIPFESYGLCGKQIVEPPIDDEKIRQAISQRPDHIKITVKVLVNAISANQYDIAKTLVALLPASAWENDEVLLAMARNFPSRLTFWATVMYPFKDISDEIISFEDAWYSRHGEAFFLFVISIIPALIFVVLNALIVPFMLLYCFYGPKSVLVYIYFSPLYLLSKLLWKVAKRLRVGPVMHIEEKVSNWKGATEVLSMVCERMSKVGTSRYSTSILEAARHNAYKVVDEILFRSPETIQSTDENGYDIIQLAVIHRSEKIYNLIYQIGERKSRSSTIKDRKGNNILHLAGKIAPLHELNRRSGAALQLQRDLQWREELKKIVFPTYINEVNNDKDTPDTVFTREHENLVKEGEKWMKATAESCSITAALIITIVFAAAITVPGGNNQEGIPVFTSDAAFTVFAVSDAISLFTSTTSLLVFLSILTTRFSEKDFLVSLPRRLIIGLCTLFLSTTAMIVAFVSSLFLVFCNKKPWMIAPICGLACLPILCFVTLQFPLLVDLVRSTYLPIFGKKSSIYHGKFNPDDVKGFFGS